MIFPRSLLPSAAHSFYLGARTSWKEKSGAIGLFISYSLLTIVWASIWRMAPPSVLASMGLTYSQIIWYCAVTELATFLVPNWIYKDIENDVRAGHMASYLLRPVDYATLRLADCLGQTCVRAVLLSPGAFALAYMLTGESVLSAMSGISLLLCLVLSVILKALIQGMVGLSTAWINTGKPLNMITQKALFVLGGLIVPLTAYPGWLQTLSWLTPFPAIMYAPASFTTGAIGPSVYVLGAVQIMWISLFSLLFYGLKKAFEHRLLTRGDL